MSKKLEEKQARRLAEERRKAQQRKESLRRNLITIGMAVLVAAIVVVAIVMQRGSGGGAVPDKVGVAASEANCGEIETFEEQEAAHINVGDAHDPYNSSPPTSGPHYEVPAESTFFTEAIPVEQPVHNLEHGMIVVWYAPDAPGETLEAIQDLVRQEPLATLAVPYTDIESPYQFVLTAWTALQRCEKVSQDVVDDFRREYQGKGPEQIAPLFEG